MRARREREKERKGSGQSKRETYREDKKKGRMWKIG